jgi:hypothetical protein
MGGYPDLSNHLFAVIMTIVDILTRRTVEDFTIGEHGICALTISGGYSLSQEALLRYVGTAGVFISASDHKHQFGLPSPYDAEAEIRRLAQGKMIRRVDVSRETGDLTLHFDDGRIEIICTSAGYEAYQLNGPGNLIMIGRGGSEENSEQAAPPNSRPPSQLPASPEVQSPDSQRTPSSGGYG